MKKIKVKEKYKFISIMNNNTKKLESAHVWNIEKDNIHIR